MRIPKKFKIAGMTWTVKYDTAVTHDEGNFGSTHYASQTIYLDPTISKQKQEQTFLHELMHVVFWHFGLTRLFDDKQEEIIVNAASNGLYHVLLDNKIME